jgi:hypothetical protein
MLTGGFSTGVSRCYRLTASRRAIDFSSEVILFFLFVVFLIVIVEFVIFFFFLLFVLFFVEVVVIIVVFVLFLTEVEVFIVVFSDAHNILDFVVLFVFVVGEHNQVVQIIFRDSGRG